MLSFNNNPSEFLIGELRLSLVAVAAVFNHLEFLIGTLRLLLSLVAVAASLYDAFYQILEKKLYHEQERLSEQQQERGCWYVLCATVNDVVHRKSRQSSVVQKEERVVQAIPERHRYLNYYIHDTINFIFKFLHNKKLHFKDRLMLYENTIFNKIILFTLTMMNGGLAETKITIALLQ